MTGYPQWFSGQLPNKLGLTVLLRARRREFTLAIVFALVILVCITQRIPYVYSNADWTERLPSIEESDAAPSQSAGPLVAEKPGRQNDKLAVLTTETPPEKFGENMRPDALFFTTGEWVDWGAGFSNQLMATMNLIIISNRMGRTPIIPPFLPTHLPLDLEPMDFSDIFLLDPLAAGLNQDVVEWKDVIVKKKDAVNSTITDNNQLACYALQPGEDETAEFNDRGPNSAFSFHLGYWILSSNWVTGMGRWDGVAKFLLQDAPRMFSQWFSENTERAMHHPLPQNQVLCTGWLFWVGSTDAGFAEMLQVDWPAWDIVGQFLRWTPQILQKSDQLISDLFGTPLGEPVDYIAVHLRLGDFIEKYCNEELQKSGGCIAPLTVQEEAVEEMRKEVKVRTGKDVFRVLVATESTDESLLSKVRSKGWTLISHETLQTASRFGEWYLPLMDMVILSRGQALVGTKDSSYSILAGRRVASWNGGPWKLVETIIQS